MNREWSALTLQLIDAARDEDLGDAGDITAALLAPHGEAQARVVARREGVICGLSVGPLVCRSFARRLDGRIEFVPAGRVPAAERGPPPAAGAATGRDAELQDGDRVTAGQTVARIRGERGVVLSAERTLLNFLSRMSGVATLTRRCVDAVHAVDPRVLVMDTRKTIPGWRELDKYAVRCGGGTNHRAGLHDAILIKDNHLSGVERGRLAATVFEMLNRAAEAGIRPAFVEVEVDDLEQLAEVCKVVGVDVALLDNFSPDELRQAVRLRDQLGLRGRLALEASGGIAPEAAAAIAACGVDRISIGALTHSAAALDLALELE